jgi:hypothetical protein
MTRYLPARLYLWFAISALALAGFSAWLAWDWTPGLIPAGLFVLTALLLFALAFLPAIEVHESHLGIGGRILAWNDIRRVDRVGWTTPMLLRLTLFDDSRLVLVYPGDLPACNGLLRQIRRMATNALIDGIPYRQYWGELLVSGKPPSPAPRARILRMEDEAEVERLYQRLKTVGNLDQKTSPDDK